MNWINAFIISNVSLIVFFGIYYLWLQKETHFQFNRAFLLFGLLFSVALPFVQLPQSTVVSAVTVPLFTLNEVLVTPETASGSFNWKQILLWTYAGIALFLALKFLAGILAILLLAFRNKRQQMSGYTLVQTDKNSIFSFFHFLFWNDELADSKSASKILLHEQTHIRQWHSLDIVLVELLKIVFWINPAIWVLHKSIRLNHEYLADAVACTSEKSDTVSYSNILLAHIFGTNAHVLENNFFNHSLTKKRIAMLTQKRSLNSTKWKYLLFIPAVFIGFYFASCTDQKEEVIKEIEVKKELGEETDNKLSEDLPMFPGGEKALIEYLSTEITYPESAKEAGIEGTTFVRLLIDEKGEVYEAEVAKGFNEACDAEALRVIEDMPRWNVPALKEGEERKVEFVLPIKFVLSDKEQ
ncbi:MAG: M56 family metallopeptidase [Chitinophagales bacterium]